MATPPRAIDVWTTPGLSLTEAELAELLELQRVGSHQSFANVIRRALWEYSKFHGHRVSVTTWEER